VSTPDGDERIVGVRPHLGEVEGVEAVRRRVGFGHDLHLHRPRRVLAALDGAIEIVEVVLRIDHRPIGLVSGVG
jgi:hypothetical protein